MEGKKSKQEESVEGPEVSEDLSDDDDDGGGGGGDVADVDAEIAELERSLAVLTARGERVREMIVEQTRLLLGEESRLSQAREEIKQNTKTTSQSSLSPEQEEFLQDLLGLENILAALRQTDKAVFRELRKRKKRPRDKSELERDKTSDSILDHPTIVGVDDPLVVNLEADYDVPTIIVEEEDLGDQVVVEYEDDVPLLLPQPPRQPPALHGHFLYHHPAPAVPHHQDHHPRHYPEPRPRYPGHYDGRYPDQQYYPQHYETLYQGEPHITLTGSLLRGFENLGRGRGFQ